MDRKILQQWVEFIRLSPRKRPGAAGLGLIIERRSRSVLIVGPDKKVKLTLTYPASTGRNFDEVLRIVDSLQRTSVNKVATPANWQPGEKVIIVPSLSDDEALELFDDFETIKPYLRTVPDPV